MDIYAPPACSPLVGMMLVALASRRRHHTPAPAGAAGSSAMTRLVAHQPQRSTPAPSAEAWDVPQYTTCSDPANQVTFTPASVVTPMTVTAGPSAVDPGDALTVSWSGVTGPTAADWVGLYPVGGTSPVAWRYTGGTASGSTMMTVPTTLRAGTYEARLREVRSGAVTVS